MNHKSGSSKKIKRMVKKSHLNRKTGKLGGHMVCSIQKNRRSGKKALIDMC